MGGSIGKGILVLVAAAALVVPRAGAARPINVARTTVRTVRLAGTERRYLLHVPVGIARGEMVPLVVAFHGAGSTTAQQERASGLSTLADRAGFVVVYPEGERRYWTASAADERFVRAVVADVARQVAVDPRRIYATGISNGASMADRAACAMGDLFAAVATVAGVYGNDDGCRPAHPVPVLAFHGLRDRHAPYTGSVTWAAAWAARNACGAAPSIATQGGDTTRTWPRCAAGADVVLQTLSTLGHAWPQDPTDRAASTTLVDATAEIWSFFAAHPMRTPTTLAVD